ncbi:DUF2066 domain-containing protein [Aliikangiella maris]|uniref:DUF2066 domain-containing protein n=2 Tax=Aliikangiella maris TaxID=3162458 RepID=A0ABV3MI51_9GAMM
MKNLKNLGLNKISTTWLLLSFGLFSFYIQAVEVEGLYQVEIAVTDQSNKVRWEAALNGLKEVLVRKSGSQQILSVYETQQAYRKVTSYLQRFEYIQNTEQKTRAEYPFYLSLHFEPRLVDELIQEAGMPIWGSNRPISILWLAKEENFQREIIKDDPAEDSLAQLVAKNAKRRGIPVILPIMDLEDQLNVNISDIWGRFNTPVVAASERYLADAVVAGRVSRFGEQWQIKLSYINQSNEQTIEFTEQSMEELAGTLVNRLAELLCEKYCVVEAAESHKIVMQISNVRNFSQYKSVQRYLESLSSIRKVEVDKLRADVVRFSLSLLGDVQSVKDGITLGNKLVEESPASIDLFVNEKSPELKPENPLSSTIHSEVTLENSENHKEVLSEQNVTSNQTEIALQTEVSKQSETLLSEKQDVVLYYRWIE